MNEQATTFTDRIQATADVVRIVKERAEAAGTTADEALQSIDEQEMLLIADAVEQHEAKTKEISGLMQMLRDHIKAAAQDHEQTIKDLS